MKNVKYKTFKSLNPLSRRYESGGNVNEQMVIQSEANTVIKSKYFFMAKLRVGKKIKNQQQSSKCSCSSSSFLSGGFKGNELITLAN